MNVSSGQIVVILLHDLETACKKNNKSVDCAEL